MTRQMRRRSFLHLRPWLASWLFIWGSIGVLSAQTAGTAVPTDIIVSSPTAADPAPPPPATIDMADVPLRAQELAEQTEIWAALGNEDLIADINKSLPDVQEGIVDANRRATRASERSTSSVRLGAISTVLAENDRQLRLWQRQLSDELNGLEEAIAEAEAQQTLWRETRDKAIKDESPGTLLTQIRASLSTVTSSRNGLERVRDSALEAQGTISYELRRLSRVSDKLDKLAKAARANLLQANSPPLWQLFNTDSTHEAVQDLSHFLTENGSALLKWAAGRLTGLVLSGAVFLLSLLFLLSSKKRLLEQLGSDSRLETTAALALRPISTSYLLFALAVPFLIGERTAAFSWLLSMGAAIPLLRLIPSLIPQSLHQIARHTVWIFVVVRAAFIFSEGAGLARMLYLIAAFMVFEAGRRFLRNAKEESRTHPLVVFASQAAMIATGSALIANLLGFSLLSATLMQGIAGSAYMGLGIIAIMAAARGFYRLLAILGPLQHLTSVKRHFQVVENTVGRVLFWIGFLLWFFNSLRAFTLREPFIAWVESILQHEWNFGDITISVGAVALFLISVWGAVMISRVIRFVLENDVLPRVGLPRGVPSTISMMLHYGIVSLGFLIALAAVGIDLSQISIVVGALGVGIGFGLQNVVNNFISGLILVFERPINVGDTVEFGTNIGQVTRIGLRSSVVRSFQGAEMIVPNGNLIASEVINWTLSDQKRRIDLPIGVAYGTDPQSVIDLLAAKIDELDYIDKEPSPWVTFEQFGDSSLDFKIRCWTDADRWLASKSALAIEINNALKAADITIPFPQRDVHLYPTEPPPSPAPAKKPRGK